MTKSKINDPLVARIRQAAEDAREAIQEGHILLQALKDERKEIQKLLRSDVEKLVEDRVKKELEELGESIKKASRDAYRKVGQQIDKLIDLSLGSEFATHHNRVDLRPGLAAKLREWLIEELNKVPDAPNSIELQNPNSKTSTN